MIWSRRRFLAAMPQDNVRHFLAEYPFSDDDLPAVQLWLADGSTRHDSIIVTPLVPPGTKITDHTIDQEIIAVEVKNKFATKAGGCFTSNPFVTDLYQLVIQTLRQQGYFTVANSDEIY